MDPFLSQALLEHLHEGVLVENMAHKPVFWNAAFARIFDILGGSIAYPDMASREKALGNYRGILEAAPVAGSVDAEISFKSADGELRHARLSTMALREFECLFTLVQDVSEMRNLEKRLCLSASRGRVAEMIFGIAHEINNPLTVLSGYIFKMRRMCSMGKADLNQILSIMEPMEATVLRTARIVHNVRNIGRGSEDERLVTINPGKLIGDTLLLCGERLRSLKVKVITDEIDDENVIGRAVQLQQILLNLIHNSVDAIEGQEDAWIRLSWRPRGDMVEILVRDSGLGIPREVVARMMEPFFTTKAKGTGLGLSLSRQMMQQMGGSLDYVAEDANTCFRLRLPRVRSFLVI